MATDQPSMMHSFNSKPQSGKATIALPVVLGIIFLAILLGVGTGFGVATFAKSSGSTTTDKTTDKDAASNETSAGVKDKKTFPDEVEGKLVDGGIEGEGSHHLERPGGESQNVYLTSSTVDLSKFTGKKVRVWGQTFEAQHAGWLMDVGYIEVVK